MNPRRIAVKVGYQVLSDSLGVMTVGFLCKRLPEGEWKLSMVVAGESYKMLHFLEEW